MEIKKLKDLLLLKNYDLNELNSKAGLTQGNSRKIESEFNTKDNNFSINFNSELEIKIKKIKEYENKLVMLTTEIEHRKAIMEKTEKDCEKFKGNK